MRHVLCNARTNAVCIVLMSFASYIVLLSSSREYLGIPFWYHHIITYALMVYWRWLIFLVLSSAATANARFRSVNNAHHIKRQTSGMELGVLRLESETILLGEVQEWNKHVSVIYNIYSCRWKITVDKIMWYKDNNISNNTKINAIFTSPKTECFRITN